MLTSTVQPVKRKLRASLAGVLMLFAFFLLGTEQAAAQTLVPADQAQQILKDEGNALYTLLLTLTPGTTTYNRTYATIHYYAAVRNSLENGTGVSMAIQTNKSAICHPTNTADCKPLPQAQAQVIIDDTETMLTN